MGQLFISTLMLILALAGTYLNADKKRSGFYFWLITNAYFSVESVMVGLYAQAALFAVFFVLAIKGLYTWKE